MNMKSNEIFDKFDDNMLDNIFNKYFELYKFIKKEKLENVNEIKPIMDGKEIQKNFPGIPFKYIGTLRDSLINRQIETSYNFSKDDAINLLKSKIQELDISF